MVIPTFQTCQVPSSVQIPDLLTKEGARFSQLVWNGSKQLGMGFAGKQLHRRYCVVAQVLRGCTGSSLYEGHNIDIIVEELDPN